MEPRKPASSTRTSRWKLHFLLLILLFVVVVFISLNFGFSQIPLPDVSQILLKNIPGIGGSIQLTDFQALKEPIIMAIRLPRILCGALVGAALAASGTIYQGMFRNPMADPFVIGASQGAALGAAIAIVLGVGTSVFGSSAIPVFAFLGCITSVLIVYSISRIGSRVPITTLLLSGIAIGLFELAIVTYLQTIAGEKLGPLTFWIIGSLSSSRITWGGLLSILPFVVVGIIITYLYSRDLNIFTLGEDQAQHLGINLERTKLILLITGAFMTAAAVSISGLIGFIGLMIPHLTRLLVGPDHRVLLPASVLLGASFLVLCDGVARLLTSPSSPSEVPVGVITVVCGVSFFLFLLRRKKRVDAF
ncbi:MAG: iron chelate uptake ABC transporter family permease subunit [Candidatus Bathyarchaeota archaeon]|nr:iron chelate uptake ABC transporter family permease subunit [Candidatus Bathyarchaeota archaeon]